MLGIHSRCVEYIEMFGSVTSKTQKGKLLVWSIHFDVTYIMSRDQ